METHAEEASKAVTSAVKKLQHAIKQKETDYTVLEPGLEKVRVRSGNLALINLLADLPADDVELKLWNNHVEVNAKFKAWLKVFREGEGRKKHVERRKAEKLYVDFIKASQRFYRAYIGRLIANFSNIPRVFDIAQKLGQDALAAQEPKPATDAQRQILEKSCKLSVIRLGDLSRWRETELQLKERNWGPAKGYYKLALGLDPAEGTCYNQLAVIARNSDDHLGAVYYLYRATAVAKPFPTATDNIKAEFEKLLEIRTEESYGLVDRSDDDLVSSLEKRFLAFHAHCYLHPYDFVSFSQRAKDILNMIAMAFQDPDTKTSMLDHFLQRACLVNLAAEDLARRGMTKNVLHKKLNETKLAQETDRNCQSYFLFQRFNLMTFKDLLKVLMRELGDEPAQPLTDLSQLSAVVRRVLAALRQYSSWLLSHMRDLIETKFKSTRNLLEDVMRTYAAALNSLKSHVDVFTSSQVGYLLDEDERTLSFCAYSDKVVKLRFYGTDKTKPKPTREDTGRGKELVEELAETHLRAMDLVVDALRLCKQQDALGLTFVPLELDVSRNFVALQVPEAEVPKPPPSPPKQTWRSRAHAQGASLNGISAPASPGRPLSAAGMPPPLVPAKEDEMSDAVQDVPAVDIAPANGVSTLEPFDTSDAMHTAEEIQPSASATFNSSSVVTGTPAPATSGRLTAMDFVKQMQQRAAGASPVSSRSPDSARRAAQPSLPSIYNTPFAPTSTEQAQLSPKLSASSRSPIYATAEVSTNAINYPNLPSSTPNFPNFGYVSPSFNKTPTGMNTLLAAFQNKDRTPSPFAHSGEKVFQGRSQPRSTPLSPAPFGVIGQPRPLSTSTPPNGQG